MARPDDFSQQILWAEESKPENRNAGMIYIEHDQALGEGALLIRWSTPRPILQTVVRKLLAVPLYCGTFVLTDQAERAAVPCICVAAHDLKSGVGILLTRGDPQPQHLQFVISLGELHRTIGARAAAAARREVNLAFATQSPTPEGDSSHKMEQYWTFRSSSSGELCRAIRSGESLAKQSNMKKNTSFTSAPLGPVAVTNELLSRIRQAHSRLHRAYEELKRRRLEMGKGLGIEKAALPGEAVALPVRSPRAKTSDETRNPESPNKTQGTGS